MAQDFKIHSKGESLRSIQDVGFFKELNGRQGGIRTHDPLLPKQMRYQAALLAD